MPRAAAIAPVLLAIAAAQEAAPQGFTPLFDGASLSGWSFVNAKDNFYARDGVLVMDKGSGWLATDRTFGDFELRATYRFVTPGADSGIFIRSAKEGANWTTSGYQIQNMDNQTIGKIVGMGPEIRGKFKAVHQEPLAKDAKKPSGEWNEMVIVARGKSVKVALNGREVAASDEITRADGHIGLQAEGGVLEFRRLDIRPL